MGTRCTFFSARQTSRMTALYWRRTSLDYFQAGKCTNQGTPAPSVGSKMSARKMWGPHSAVRDPVVHPRKLFFIANR